MNETCPIVWIKNKNGLVRINENEYDAEKHGPLHDPNTGEPVNTGEPSPQLAVVEDKKKKKFFVVNSATGDHVERDGIDAGGYASDADAWAAIMALANG